MLNQYAVDNPTLPVNQCLSHLYKILAGCWAVLGECWAATPASSSSLYPGGFNPWIPNATEHISPHVTSERQIPDTALDPRCQSGPSARDSFRLQWEKIFRGLWGRPTKTADFGTSLWQIPYSNNICLLEDKGMYLFAISYRSYDVDQRSGNGWISGWSQIFAF